MARARNHGNGRLEEAMVMQQEAMAKLEEAMAKLDAAMAHLVQTQAIFVQNQAAFQAQIAETNRRMAEMDRQIVDTNRINSERFARIETILLDHTRILAEHTEILRMLPDAIRDKMGFRAPTNPDHHAAGRVPPAPPPRSPRRPGRRGDSPGGCPRWKPDQRRELGRVAARSADLPVTGQRADLHLQQPPASAGGAGIPL